MRLSRAARGYLRRETAYLVGHDRAAALRFTRNIEAALRSLSDFERLGAASAELPVTGLRRLVAGDYLLFYEVVGDEIGVLTIRHGRQRSQTETENDFDYEADRD